MTVFDLIKGYLYFICSIDVCPLPPLVLYLKDFLIGGHQDYLLEVYLSILVTLFSGVGDFTVEV